MSDRDRVTPVEPRKPIRPRLNTERGVAPPGAGNRQPPRPIPREDLDETLEEGHPPDPRDATIAELEAERAQLERQVQRLAHRQPESQRIATPPGIPVVRPQSASAGQSVAPSSGRHMALVIDKRGAYVPRWIAVLLLPVLAGGWGVWDRFQAMERRLDAIEAREADKAKKEAEAAPEAKSKAERVDAFHRGVIAWLARLAQQQQIGARQDGERIEPVKVEPVRMPTDRPGKGPLFRAEESLPEPP